MVNQPIKASTSDCVVCVDSTIVGVVCKDGIIIGTEKIVVNKMMVSGTDKRAFNMTKQTGCVVNGIIPDGKAIMFRGREEAKQYEENFGIKVPGKVLAERLANFVQMKTVYSSQRPFGSSIIISAFDHMKGPTLWMVEPAGTVFQYYGCASGRGRQFCRNEIEKGFFREETVSDALPRVAKMLLKAQEEMRDKKQELELSVLVEQEGKGWG